MFVGAAKANAKPEYALNIIEGCGRNVSNTLQLSQTRLLTLFEQGKQKYLSGEDKGSGGGKS